VELVPALRSQPADVRAQHLLGEARGLPEGDAARVREELHRAADGHVAVACSGTWRPPPTGGSPKGPLPSPGEGDAFPLAPVRGGGRGSGRQAPCIGRSGEFSSSAPAAGGGEANGRPPRP